MAQTRQAVLRNPGVAAVLAAVLVGACILFAMVATGTVEFRSSAETSIGDAQGAREEPASVREPAPDRGGGAISSQRGDWWHQFAVPYFEQYGDPREEPTSSDWWHQFAVPYFEQYGDPREEPTSSDWWHQFAVPYFEQYGDPRD